MQLAGPRQRILKSTPETAMNANTHSHSSWDEDAWMSPKDDPMEEIHEEIASYSANFARSNEQGWFYSDWEEGIDAIPDPSCEDD
jgi:hypothetical protein